MSRDRLIGIDIGTTSTKAVVVSAAGSILGEASREVSTTYPRPGWAQQDPDDWWRAVCHVLGTLIADGTLDPQNVAGVTVSCQAPSLVAVDTAGIPLFPAIIWMDRRSDGECDWLRMHVGEERIAAINGGRVDPYYLAPKLIWFRTHEPALYARTHVVLQANGYIVHKLCGRFTLDISHCPLTLFFDSATQTWSPALMEAMGLDPDKLPPVLDCAAVAGEVTAAAARATGLRAGTPILAGMTDGTAAGVEAGLVNPGDAVEMTGQSTVLLICSDRPYLGSDLIPLGHPVPGRHLVAGAVVASGGALRWFRDQLGAAERDEAAARGLDAYTLLAEQAATSPIGANRLVFLPYMYGERSPIWDSNARGVFFGLSLASTKADMIRAIMEGAAFGLRHNVETAAAGGIALQRLACVGGGARSRLWNQIKADVLQRPVHLPAVATGAPMGDAIVAAAGVGLYPSIDGAVAAMVRPGAEIRPHADTAAIYDALYTIYAGLYPTVRGAFKALAEVPDAD